MTALVVVAAFALFLWAPATWLLLTQRPGISREELNAFFKRHYPLDKLAPLFYEDVILWLPPKEEP